MHSKLAEDYIIEFYEDRSQLNSHTLNYVWARVREWIPENKRYEVYDHFGTATIIKILLSKHGVKDIDKIPVVDLVNPKERYSDRQEEV